ncbi:MAG TPA: type II toxin-antitoxin system HicB family antitoxin [Stellaceae bacterium]|nr:type II toxin-antitoxin system HicB family antitoxin [Stellaceae bacterium]
MTLAPEPAGGFVVTFPDLPEAITQGEDREDALLQATDCLEEAIAGRLQHGDDIPTPSRGKLVVTVPPTMAAKAALHLALREAGLSKSDLARRLRCDEKEARRLLDPTQPSKIERLSEALHALGKELIVSVRDAA